ncbi:MAG: DEAD/DEAH box helicase [Pseudomonadota bacterium]|nr:DEAD/DEAH box helicase [Pseudomonadota bacterium]
MAKRLVTDPEDLGVESQLIRAIGDLAAGRLQAIIDGDGDLNYASTADRTGSGRAVDALLRRLHAGVIQLARELVTRPPEDPEAIAVSQAQTIFSEVKNLCIATLEGVFDADGPHAVSVFPGPLHLAKLLLAVSGDLAEAGICRVRAPSGINAGKWWRIIRRAARKRPYLWRNHRAALDKSFLFKGMSAVVSFPTGGGKSTLAEMKIAASLLGGGKVVVLAPTLALVDQTAFTLKNAFHQRVRRSRR